MANRLEIGDEEWDAVYPILAAHKRVRMASKDACRGFLVAVLWVLRSGAQWRLLSALTPEGTEAFVGDQGHDSNALIQAIRARGMEAVIPPRSHRTEPREVDWLVYKKRHLIGCFFNTIKH